MSEKTCSRCEITKDVSEFGKAKKGKGGLRSECRECYNARMNQYYHSNEGYRERSKKQNRENHKKIRIEVLRHYGGENPKCECCGEFRYEFLSVDHIHGNGSEDRKIGRESTTLCRWIIKNNFPDTFRILCINCNFAIGIHGCCPHQKKRASEEALNNNR